MSLKLSLRTFGLAVGLLAAAPIWAQNTFTINCGQSTTVNPGSTVNCAVVLSLAAGVQVDSLNYNIQVNGSNGAPVVDPNSINFTDGLTANDASHSTTFSTQYGNNFATPQWVKLSPVLTGAVSQTTGTFSFTVPSTASATATPPNTYTVTFGAQPPGAACCGNSPSNVTTSVVTGSVTLSMASVLTFASPAAGALPGATATAAYSQTFTASGGTTPYTWKVSAGALPAGLSIATSSNNGVISGTPTATGPFSFTVTATDSESPTVSVSRAYTLAVSPAITALTPATLPAGTVGAAYNSGTISVTGGSSPYTFSSTVNLSGTYGLTLTASGATTAITGTPTAPASALSIPIKVTDANGATFTGNVSLTINGPLTLSPVTGTTLLPGSVGFAYTTPIAPAAGSILAGGGTPPYKYSAGGVLPGGLTLNTSTGAITGTPTTANTFSNVQVTVSDSAGTPATVTNTYTIVINPALTLTSPGTIPNDTATVAYPTTGGFTAAGGSGTYNWTAATGVPGLTVTATGATASIGGTPTTAGTYTVTVTVTDANSPGVSVSKTYNNVVIAPGVSITAPPAGALKTGTVGTVYAGTGATITSSGGTAPYVWSISAGTLPPGLALTGTGTGSATGLISGTPTGTITTPVTSTFTVQVQDTNGTGSLSTRQYTITVYAAPTLTGPATLPTGAVGSPYTTAPNPFTQAGGAPTIAWSATGLPSGLTINSSTGLITGTPAAGANTGSPYTVTVTVTDGDGVTAAATTKIAVNPAITVTPATFPVAVPGVAYSTALTPGGGSGAGYTFAATGLPTNGGLTLSAAGVLSGTPSAAANASPYAVTVTVTDGNGSTHAFPYSLAIAPPLMISAPTSVPAGLIGAQYAGATVTVTGGTQPYAFTATGLPPGLTIGSGTGTISGIPTAVAGSPYTVIVKVTDKNNTTATVTLSIVVSALPLQIITGLLPTGVVNTPYPFTSIQVQGGVTPYTYSITGLPPGLTTDGSGNIMGTPTSTAGSPFTVVLTLGDATKTSISRTYSLAINGVLTVAAPTTLPAATLNAAYAPVTAMAGGGLPPYTWTATGFPTGMSVNIANGVISGTPTTAAGSPYSVVLTVEDSSGKTASMTYSLAFNSGPPTITGPASLPNGTLGVAYVSTTVTASGGSGVYTWSATGLPAGLSIGSGTGAITGTPSGTVASVNTVVVTVTDSSTATATKSYTLTVNPAPSSLPVITSVSASTEGQSVIGPNTWVSIYGSNFAQANFTDTWTTSIKNSATGALPIILDGVSAAIGGQAGYMYYLSATQINVLMPNIGLGPLQVTVTTPAGTSNAVTVTSQQLAPGIFEFPSGCTGNCQPVATHADYSAALANGTIAGVTTVPAAPGETIILWGSGFGPTTPAIPYGVAVPSTAVYTTNSNISATLNSAPITVYQNVAVLASGNAGLYQMGVTVPAGLANGSYPLVVTINGVVTPTLYLTVHN